jgi:ubiquinol-cytochrome c reductase cytochrome c1 subunit
MRTMMTPFRLSAAAAFASISIAATVPANAAGDGAEIHRNHWSFGGMFGSFDKPQLQRGYQVYKEVCATCHSVSRMSFRNLAEKGGPEFPASSVAGLAAGTSIEDGPGDDGKMFKRPGRMSDRIPGPYKNEQEARSIHNGALPPDLSLMAKARNVEYTGPIWYHPIAMLKDMATGYQEGGADYIYALLTGYKDKAPAYRKDGLKLVAVSDKDVRDEKAVQRCVAIEKGETGKADTCSPLADLMNYNVAYPGHQIAMAQPIRDGQVKYSDGTKPTVENYAADLATFLSWTADPTLEERKRLGWQVMMYLLITSILLYVAKKRIWADKH